MFKIKEVNTIITVFSFSLLLFTVYLWMRDLVRERTYCGKHPAWEQGNIKWGIVWFIFREVWFFFRIFWTFFHYRLSVTEEKVYSFPFFNIETIAPFQVPLLNTIILLMRGITATVAHYDLLRNKQTIWIYVSALLGIYFLGLQGTEYSLATFRIRRGVYGRVFFFGTGFHGFHVCLGVLILIVRALRLSYLHYNRIHHVGLEFRLWYWHFVDVVWLFLYVWVYMWRR